MTDNKIIKAYSERCDKLTDVNLYLTKLCDEKDDLINRLKAENERLKEVEKRMLLCLANERDAIADCLNEAVAEAKSEAVKEFAEKLLRKATFMCDEESINGVVRVGDIYETLEEMG